jgi:hypothetical protein
MEMKSERHLDVVGPLAGTSVLVEQWLRARGL